MVSTHLKNISQNGFIFPNFRGEHKKYLSCHHSGIYHPLISWRVKFVALHLQEKEIRIFSLSASGNLSSWKHPKKSSLGSWKNVAAVCWWHPTKKLVFGTHCRDIVRVHFNFDYLAEKCKTIVHLYGVTCYDRKKNCCTVARTTCNIQYCPK